MTVPALSGITSRMIQTDRKLELVPGWPGDDVYPPQPMVSQMRNVLQQYQANGGAYREVAVEDAGHGAHIEKPGVFEEALRAHLR